MNRIDLSADKDVAGLVDSLRVSLNVKGEVQPIENTIAVAEKRDAAANKTLTAEDREAILQSHKLVE
jgi:hypothetical protein